MFFTKFTAERCPHLFSVCIQAANGLVHTHKKSALCSRMHLCVHSKSKYKLETPCSAVDNGCSVDNYCSSGLGISDSQLVRPKKRPVEDGFTPKVFEMQNKTLDVREQSEVKAKSLKG